MNAGIASLHAVSAKQTRIIIGLMSGTSLDGLDVALCRLVGSGTDTEVSLMAFKTVPYDDEIKSQIRTVFARTTVDLLHLTLLNRWIGRLHAAMIKACLADWGISSREVDAVASHGQTVMHAPEFFHGQTMFGNGTLQIGDGDHVAVETGILTLSDFRQKHIAAGGQGAPLAVYGDYLIFADPVEHRILLNMGGIANFTYLPAAAGCDDVFVTDTGPGNTLLDTYVRATCPGLEFDRDAGLAARGTVDAALLAAMKTSSFFREPLPRTIGPELFNLDFIRRCQTETGTQGLAVPDVLATLTRFSAETIAETLLECLAARGAEARDFRIYASGGGCHNPLLMRLIRERLPCPIGLTDALGIPGDAKEAVLFAVLANETLAGGRCSFGDRQGVPSVSLGKISLPA
ncbi:MAG: anhydro-N-acetylmuramic acid kinase [Brevundimonas sp. 12-68-7]|uniref:Anhydro-N-acetylmuramic acid kinase n=1 Tax=Brevundimonas subvibrioides TaxID=74313 RepID=A0A258FHP4_9CAUL|nr:MAG: anhydro-N-acetylmuramic acid kinase [Brevundimonas sp. 12-68-7]OYX32031.1 MAG: anhydro-N-acetylmuramic acid kinase [Brevundimonas subvibrioides]